MLIQKRKQRIKEHGKRWEARKAAQAKEFQEYAAAINHPDRVKAVHDKWVKDMEAKGIPVLAK